MLDKLFDILSLISSTRNWQKKFPLHISQYTILAIINNPTVCLQSLLHFPISQRLREILVFECI